MLKTSIVSFLICLMTSQFCLGKDFTYTLCRDGWMAFNGSCYLFGHDQVHFTEAESFCRIHGSHLVEIEDALENAFIKDRLRTDLQSRNWWIGLTDEHIEGVFEWFGTNTVATYFDWYSGEPDPGAEDCVGMWYTWDWQWGDVGCTAYKCAPICEIRGEVRRPEVVDAVG